MKILVVGNGGREHALAWKCAQSAKVKEVFVAPGNGGTALEKKCSNVPLRASFETQEGIQELIAFSKKMAIDMVFIGPEAPLAAGIVDSFRSAGLVVLGPDSHAARLESSKLFSKEFMQKHGVRAAQSIGVENFEQAKSIAEDHFMESATEPLVIKADGLAAGKGVVVATSLAMAVQALDDFMCKNSLGDAGKTVLIEDYLQGVEVSVLAAVSICPNAGIEEAIILPFVPARDHKRRYNNGEGPNTGGMGAIAPVSDFDAVAQKDFHEHILMPTLRGIHSEGMDYRGFIFFGLMVDGGRCSLLEYNVRLGDPETQAVLPLMESDIIELCQAIEAGKLSGFDLRWKKAHSCAPVAVSDGYPGPYRKGDFIKMDLKALEQANCKVFVAGARQEGDKLITTGGRVLAVQALAADMDEARNRAYRGMGAVGFEGMGFRTDIGIEGNHN